MSLPTFVRGLILLLIVFGLVTYAVTGSFQTTLVGAAMCALLVQIGYFVLVLLMIRSGLSGRHRPATAS